MKTLKYFLTLILTVTSSVSLCNSPEIKSDKEKIKNSIKAIQYLLKNKVLKVDQSENLITIDLQNKSSKEILEILESEGVFNEEVAVHSPWCE